MSLYKDINISAGLDDALINIAQQVPAFPIMMLVFTFFTVLISGSASQRNRTGYADVPFWAILSSTTTTMLALIMTLGAGMLDIVTLSIVISLNILCAVWFFLSKSKGEV